MTAAAAAGGARRSGSKKAAAPVIPVFDQCAVVGDSAGLLSTRLGQLIDRCVSPPPGLGLGLRLRLGLRLGLETNSHWACVVEARVAWPLLAS